LAETNDIAFHAVRLLDEYGGGVTFRLSLAGITGHRDFARESSVVVSPDECIPVAAAIVRVFMAHGNRTDRKRARLKYLLDEWGLDRFLGEVECELGQPLRRVPADAYAPRADDDRYAHVGVHPQRQPGLNYVGVVLPVGRITSHQLRSLADVSESCGDGDLRLTVWQNLLIANVPDDRVSETCARIEAMGLDWRASRPRAGLVACTGNAGCKFAAANTKRHALLIAEYVEQHVELDRPINIHITGCPNSCAQHYVGDIGLIAASVERGDDLLEGYQVVVGGGYGRRQRIARPLYAATPADELPALVARMVEVYMHRRAAPDEEFSDFVARHSEDELRAMFSRELQST
jgi:ferredoxin-nitrite reductase